jgi:hypothetical protein
MHVSKRSHDLNLLEVTSAEDPNESWHAGGTLAASKQHQAARQDATKYLSLLESGGGEKCRAWTFNPARLVSITAALPGRRRWRFFGALLVATSSRDSHSTCRKPELVARRRFCEGN